MARSKVDAGPSPPEGNSFVFHQPRAGPTEPGMSRQLVSSVGPDWLKVLHAAEPIVSREVKQADVILKHKSQENHNSYKQESAGGNTMCCSLLVFVS